MLFDQFFDNPQRPGPPCENLASGLRYAAKMARRREKERHGADELFLDGEWNVADLTSDVVKSLKKSEPVLSGGVELQRLAAASYRATQQQPRKNEFKKTQRDRVRAERRTCRALAPPKLRGKHRPRLPESLRLLYGAGEDTENRLFEILEPVPCAIDYASPCMPCLPDGT